MVACWPAGNSYRSLNIYLEICVGTSFDIDTQLLLVTTRSANFATVHKVYYVLPRGSVSRVKLVFEIPERTTQLIMGKATIWSDSLDHKVIQDPCVREHR